MYKRQDENQLTIFQSQNPTTDYQFLWRTKNGKRQFLFLVHPESESFFRSLSEQSTSAPVKFHAIATASSRTLVLWNQDIDPFFGKVSLDVEIGGLDRKIPDWEVSRSVGLNDMVRLFEQNLSNTSRFLKEEISAIPKGWELSLIHI